MRIAIVSKANAPGGGASRVAEDQARWLRDAGHDVTHFCGDFVGQSQDFQRPLFGSGFADRVLRKVERRTRRLGLCDGTGYDLGLQSARFADGFDVLHFHDHYRTFSMRLVSRLSRSRPVVFTAHDCLHFTGGCLYPLGCNRFAGRCGACPQRGSIGRFDLTGANLRYNRQAAAAGGLAWIYPSRWLADLSASSIDHRGRRFIVPYGFDPAPYRFTDREVARRELGLPADRPVVCISAHYLGDRRKGVSYALAAVASVRDLRPVVLLVGNPAAGITGLLGDVPCWFTGYVADRPRLGSLYAASDVFLFCPLEDNLPISVQESMAAATPVVGFSTGGIPEMAADGETGWLVPTGDQSALDAALRRALTTPDRDQVGRRARERMVSDFSVAGCVRRLEEVYGAVRGQLASTGRP